MYRLSKIPFIAAFLLANLAPIPGTAQENDSSVHVEGLDLTEVQQAISLGLNVGAVSSNPEFARGLQKAADVYGLKLDILVSEDPTARQSYSKALDSRDESFLILEGSSIDAPDTLSIFGTRGLEGALVAEDVFEAENLSFEDGYAAFERARSAMLESIPKYDQILPYAFPVSPLPDTFFQASKFPYPSPLIRAPRTNESASASVHSHVSCNMVAQTGNMLHRTSSIDENRLLMGMEGGNLSLQADPGSIDADKVSAVMTSWVLNIADDGVNRRILVENNGLESSLFDPGIHAPEELALTLEDWVDEGTISGFRFIDHQTVELLGLNGDDVVFEAGMFLVANDFSTGEPEIILGSDLFGNPSIDFYSTQAFVQQLVAKDFDANVTPNLDLAEGGILTRRGASTDLIGRPLSHIITETDTSGPVPSYQMSLEGGFVAVTPEAPLSASQLDANVEKIYLDLRGPLTSDQTISVFLGNGSEVVFRRTVRDFAQLNDALALLKSQGLISGWEFEGVRGQGLFANVVLFDFLGKHRKFMSSLATWPTDEQPEIALTRFYVDGMQRLNFTYLSTGGWRQEFVEVPLRIPPVPRDVALFTGQSDLN